MRRTSTDFNYHWDDARENLNYFLDSRPGIRGYLAAHLGVSDSRFSQASSGWQDRSFTYPHMVELCFHCQIILSDLQMLPEDFKKKYPPPSDDELERMQPMWRKVADRHRGRNSDD